MDLAEIQRAIETLPKDQQAALAVWLAERDQAEWDAEIESDFSPGGAGIALLEEMKAEARAGKFRPFEQRRAAAALTCRAFNGLPVLCIRAVLVFTTTCPSKCSAWLINNMSYSGKILFIPHSTSSKSGRFVACGLVDPTALSATAKATFSAGAG